MADHSSNHRADNSVVPDDDPFAELTRIMGHDPRQGDNSAAEIDQGGDDLALELENELLGDLADFTEEGVDASARAGEQQLHQSNDWRFEPVPDGAPATKDEFEPSVDLTADMTDELDKEFGGGLRFEPATEEAGVPEPLALGSTRSSAPDYRTDGDAGTDIQPEAPVDDAVFEFSEQDFALLDADLDASISDEDTEIPNERRGDGDEPVSGPAMPMAVPEPEGDAAFPSSDMNADGMARDEDAHEPSPASADPFLSPQAFASSVANGASGLSAGDDLVETYDHGFAASLEEELSAGASAAEEVADDAMEPHRDAKSDSEFSWDPFDGSSSPDSTGSESAQAETGDSIPFWRETEQSSPSLRGGEKDTPPIVDTVSVPGNERVQVEDANHIPEFVSEPERFPEAEPDDLERALARAFGDNESLPEPEPEPLRRDDEPSSSLPNDAYATAALGARGTDAEDYDFDAAFSDDFGAPDGFNPPGVSGTTMLEPGRDDPQFVATDNPAWENGSLETESDAEPFAGDAEVVAPTRRNRGGSGRTTLIAGALGGVAVLGLLGFFALGGSGEDGSAPVVVRADDGPVKVKPENPGGQQVPNQDNQVYQRVSGSEAGNNPVQERLVSTAEEPVEVPKSEERLASNTNGSATPTSEPVTAMQPRRVRTMVVRPDGTIVPREPVETPVANADTARDPAAGGSQVANVNSPQAVNTTSPDARLRGTAESVAPTAESGTSEAGVPQTAPVPATRPSPPPVQRQPQPAADPAPAARVASAPSQPAQPAAQPQPPAAAPVTSGGGDGWSVQISSQPTVDAAQKSYQDMARRYGSLLTGKGVNIVKADIAGKGTYYRVRIPSSSKDEAIRLCSQLKSAGGSCFVSK